MEERMPRQMPAQTAEQKAIFERVWKRVMADREEESPLVWEEPARPEEETGLAPLGAGDPAPEEAEGTAAPAAPRPMGPHGDFPRETGVLGEGCLDCGPLLQELVRRELTDCREYQALARRAGGSPGRVLAGLAGEKKRRAKRLSAAYFLISGVRYWPEGRRRGGALVLRDPAAAVCPGAGHHGGLSGGAGGDDGPLPAADVLGTRPGELGARLPDPQAGGERLSFRRDRIPSQIKRRSKDAHPRLRPGVGVFWEGVMDGGWSRRCR